MRTDILRHDTSRLKRVARLMKTIGHPARLSILELLLERGKMPVKDIYEVLSISQSSTSQHLKAMEDLGILFSVREGKHIYYRVQNPAIGKLLQCVGECTDC